MNSASLPMIIQNGKNTNAIKIKLEKFDVFNIFYFTKLSIISTILFDEFSKTILFSFIKL